ncbi:hypothetical protein NX773_10490 [Massilia solisilvae]|uniref:PrcB C-terminal domain-containing protein n=1 Tax=Massilia solisilvae TaxID=1811225 RepID=A0ABT2BJA8_9BURK|nr:protease complex subunit PrcB family protein [Massilia solisilvae]MCS0608590.1 hypothetical protein [Massilia solisilvae]
MGLHRVHGWVGSLVTVLALASCGGGASDAPARQAGQAGSGGPSEAPVVADFVRLAQQEPCGDLRNRLYLIDGKQVFWDRAGTCPDNGYSQRLFGANPQTVLCEATDTLAGMKTFCANEAMRALFETIQKNIGTPTLGLDASHKVEFIPFLPKSGSALPFRVLARQFTSGVTVAQSVVVRDQAGFEQLWSQHVSKPAPVPGMPTVDFSTSMVVGVFMGDRHNCMNSMGVVRIGSQDGRMLVDVEDASVSNWPCPPLVTAPMELVVLDRNDAPADFVRHATERLLTTELDRTAYSLVSVPRRVVIKDAAGWAALWAQHAGSSRALPQVDFGTRMVVGVFLGQSGGGCYTTDIQSISSNGSKITVRYTDTVPGPASVCTKNITSPAWIVAAPRSDMPVEFVREVAEFPGPEQSF